MRYENLKRHYAEEEIFEKVGICPKCGNDVVLKKTRYGNFHSCSNYPQCSYIDKIEKSEVKSDKKCPQCDGDLLIKQAKRGAKYLSCSNYPKCKYAEWIKDENDNIIINDDIDSEFVSHSKKGVRDDINEDVMSSWEANVIRLFNHLKINYAYESDLYDLNKNNCDYKYMSPCYIPDFVLSDGTLIEVKGNLDYRSLQNMKRFKELYPNENIIVIDRDIYYLLEKKYSSLISNWEKTANTLTCYIDVVGITFKERKQFVDKLNENDELYIVRELDNKFDKNAIKVLDKDNNHIGYISGDYACYYAPKIDKGIKYKLMVKERKEKVLKCSINATNLDSYDVSEYLDIFK